MRAHTNLKRTTDPLRQHLVALLWMAATSLGTGSPLLAHGLAEHAGAGGVQRRADGSLFVPLSVQREHGVQVAAVAGLTGNTGLNLPARVIADPAAVADVTATLAGTLQAPPGGFPALGERLQRDQLLGYLLPALGSLELADLKTDLANARAERDIARRELDQYEIVHGVARLEQLKNDSNYIKLRATAEGAKQQYAVLRAALDSPVELRAPLAGSVSEVQAIAGAVVQTGARLFEIVDATRLWVSALSYDTGIEPPRQAQAVTADGRRLELELVGQSPRLTGQTLSLLYRILAPPPGLALGQALALRLDASSGATPALLPPSSVQGDGEGGHYVWVQRDAEHFAARTIRARPLAGGDFALQQGLQADESIVTRGAELFPEPD